MSSDMIERKLEIANERIAILEKMIEERTAEIYLEHLELMGVKEYLDKVLEAMESALMVVDSNGNISTINRALLQFSNFQENELIGSPAKLIFPEIDEHISPEKVGSSVSSKIETTLLSRSGQKVPVFLSIARMNSSGDRKKGGVVLVAHDLTEYKQLESQLLQSQKLESVGHLAAGIAHEINTPIQYVGDNIRFLQESFQDLAKLFSIVGRIEAGEADATKELTETASSIDLSFFVIEIPNAIQQSLEGVGRVAKIVQAMKEFSHPGSEQKQASDLNRLIESTLTVSSNEWKYVAEITTHFDQNMPLVPCHPGEFNQVILNLIVNAAHAIEDASKDGKRGKISVSTACVGDWVEVRISDTGCGIPEEHGSRIFDPFFTTKKVGRGTGQGLSIAHSVIVEKHQGKLSFESKVGEGTTFIIQLPLIAAQS